MAFNSIGKRNAQLAKENKKLHHYGMKLRAIPTSKQHEFILQSVGFARLTFNFYFNEKQEVYRETGETLNCGEFKKAFNGLKDHPEFKWLKISDKSALECAWNKWMMHLTGFLKVKINIRNLNPNITPNKVIQPKKPMEILLWI